jgi:hypothetical protein
MIKSVLKCSVRLVELFLASQLTKGTIHSKRRTQWYCGVSLIFMSVNMLATLKVYVAVFTTNRMGPYLRRGYRVVCS